MQSNAIRSSDEPRRTLTAPARGASAPPMIDSATLFSEGREIQICHNGGIYTLRQTRQGKLILTK